MVLEENQTLPPPAVELKQRFIRALQHEDALTALRAYTCSVAGLDKWKQEEEAEKLRIEEEQRIKQLENKQVDASWRKKNNKSGGKYPISQVPRDEHSVDTIRHSNKKRSSIQSHIPSQRQCPCPCPPLGLGGRKSKLFDAASASASASSSSSSNEIFEKEIEEEKEEEKEEIVSSYSLPAETQSDPGVLETKLDPSASITLFQSNLAHGDEFATKDKKSKKSKKKTSLKHTFNFLHRSPQPNDVNTNTVNVVHNDDYLLDLDQHIGLMKDKENGITSLQFDKSAITTPLHEAARLGSLELVKALLARGGDPNERDGLRRTSLHLICGGFTNQEEYIYNLHGERKGDMEDDKEEKEKDIGIRLYVPQSNTEHKREKKKNSISNIFHNIFGNGKKNLHVKPTVSSFSPVHRKVHSIEESERLRKRFSRERMETLWAILTSSAESPTLNSVDGRGRTALHYAAELGREDICSSLLGHENVILTIIDENGRTPCELAGMHGHKRLAAQLEARALMGGGEDMMILAGWSMLQEEDLGRVNSFEISDIGGVLAPPFSWFDTLENVEGVRTNMIEETKSKLDAATVELLASIDYAEKKTEIYHRNHHHCEAFIDQAVKSLSESSNPNNDSKDSCLPKQFPPEILASVDKAMKSYHKFEKEPKIRLSQFKDLTLNQTSQLLTYFKWDSNLVVEAYRKNPIQVLMDAEVIPISRKVQLNEEADDENICLICCDEFPASSSDWVHLQHCDHSFCRDCLSNYISSCADSRDIGILSIRCPHHECSVYLDISEVEHFTGSTYNDSYNFLLQIENENFVSTARDYSFCPSPGCQGIVHCQVPSDIRKKFDHDSINYLNAVCTFCSESNGTTVRTYEGVLDSNYNSFIEMPRFAHRFCYTCKKAPHWPISCEMHQEWKEKVAEEVRDLEVDKYEDIAQNLWMRANTRPCPKCQVPIEKNDGCNHMTCTNKSCKHEFCWICRKDWKLHSTKTGGYFRCNRWQGEDEGNDGMDERRDNSNRPPTGADNPDIGDEFRYGTALHAARMARKKNRAMARFLHHYSRWSAHRESATLERKMQESVCERMSVVVNAATEFGEFGGLGTLGNGLSFIHAAFTELLECRSMLEFTYPFAFYRYAKISPIVYRIKSSREIEKINFESLQSELEMLTEQMSDIVARKHLRATMTQIMFLTSAAAEKRRELNMFMMAMGHDYRRKMKEKNKKRTDKKVVSIVPPTSQEDDCDSDHNEISDEALMEILARSTMRPGQNAGRPVHPASLNVEWDTSAADIVPNTRSNMNFVRHQQRTGGDEDAAFQLAVQASIRSHIAFTNEAMNAHSSDEDDDVNGWNCSACTYTNRGGRHCAMCGSRR